MTQEEKQILLVDLCARLPYGVKVSLQFDGDELIGTLDAVYPSENRVIIDKLNKPIALINVRNGGFILDENNIKPYLRPMSSMTDEEIHEVQEISGKGIEIREAFILSADSSINSAVFNWFNAHHFDYRGLIKRGLALEAPEDMYKEAEKMTDKELEERMVKANETYMGLVDKFIESMGKKNVALDDVHDKLCRMLLCLFADWHREQMMKDAIEAVINSKENDVILYSSLPTLIRKKGWCRGDKVKLIIIKED